MIQESLKMGSIGCPETSARNYHYTLRNIPEERSSRLLRGRRLKSIRLIFQSLLIFGASFWVLPQGKKQQIAVHVFVCNEQRKSQWKDFREISYL
jgi:hypothetical protein